MALNSSVSKSNLIHQFKALLPNILIIYLPCFFILLIIGLQTKIPIGNLTRDPLALVGKPFYFGIVSQIGNLFWCSCAAICFFSAALLTKNKPKINSLYLLYAGFFTSFLLLDDLFLIHEDVFPNYLKISEKIIYLIYVSFLIFYIMKFKRVIVNTEFLPLLLAFFFFGFSVLVDKDLIPISQYWLENEGVYLLEDGAKLLGIISWFIYFTRVCLTQIKQVAHR